jgi:dipicolinate synthase subunit A
MSSSGPPLIAVVGGDRREDHLVSCLRASGHRVLSYGRAASADGATAVDAVRDVDWLVCPTPGLSPDGALYAPFHDRPIVLTELLEHGRRLPIGGVVLGVATDEVRRVAAARAIVLHQVADNEDVRCRFAESTAEGVVGTIITSTDRLLPQLRVLVLGTGRTAAAIARLLRAWNVPTASAGRREAGLARMAALGVEAVPYSARVRAIAAADVVVTTVPAPDAVPVEALAACAGKLVIDIASPPGGMDHDAARASGADVRWLRGVAGRRAPVSSGEALYEMVRSLVGPPG